MRLVILARLRRNLIDWISDYLIAAELSDSTNSLLVRKCDGYPKSLRFLVLRNNHHVQSQYC